MTQQFTFLYKSNGKYLEHAVESTNTKQARVKVESQIIRGLAPYDVLAFCVGIFYNHLIKID